MDQQLSCLVTGATGYIGARLVPRLLDDGHRIQPIAVRDVLHYLVAAATAAVPCSRIWDIGGPDVLEYGDIMRVYAQVAGLHRRYLFVLPFLTLSIASLRVGTVTSGLARPLIESLECGAVLGNSDIDTIIAPPPDGLTPLPTRGIAVAQPGGAGATGCQLGVIARRAGGATAQSSTPTCGRHRPPRTPRTLWAAAETAATSNGRLDRDRARTRHPVAATLPIPQPRDRVARDDGRPAGRRWQHVRAAGDLRAGRRVGRLYWFFTRPLHTVALAALVRNVVGAPRT